MKTISFLQILVIIFFLFLKINSVFCEDNEQKPVNKERNYSFSFGASVGLISGLAQEYVYVSNQKDNLLSELLWDLKPVFYLGLNIDFCRSDLLEKTGFFSSLSFKAGIPYDSGVIENRDWMNNSNRNELTHFSSHTNKTKEYFQTDVVIGVSIPVLKSFYLIPFISGSWMHFSFSGRNGNGNYIWYDPPEVSYQGQEVIRYKQDWLLIAAGLSIGTNILSPFAINISFQISPFTYCIARDDHLSVWIPEFKYNNITYPAGWTNPRTYYDYTSFGLFIEPKANISLTWKSLKFSLEYSYRFIDRTIGASFKDEGNGIVKNDFAGAGISFMDFKFLFSIKI
ncbi:MAG: omptin family outer membrane protease [Treponema sp.]|nr:omptin family outer membrane protease [Treponema sp.]MCL2250300.1 omptin family outer membrane protease [Treponema sp.]